MMYSLKKSSKNDIFSILIAIFAKELQKTRIKMILEIRLSNFFSIMDEVVLDMQAANIQTK